MPFGTRGGMVAEHWFAADGEYSLTIGDMAMAREVPKLEFENTVIALLDGKEFYRVNIGGEKDYKDIDQNLDAGVYHVNSRCAISAFHATAGSTSWRSPSCVAATPKAMSACDPILWMVASSG